MGRNQIDIKPLPILKINATFNQRKEGLKHKAWELGILCDCEVALIVFPPQKSNNNFELIDLSVNGSIDDILKKYTTFQMQNPGREQMKYDPRSNDSTISSSHKRKLTLHQPIQTNYKMNKYVPNMQPNVQANEQDIIQQKIQDHNQHMQPYNQISMQHGNAFPQPETYISLQHDNVPQHHDHFPQLYGYGHPQQHNNHLGRQHQNHIPQHGIANHFPQQHGNHYQQPGKIFPQQQGHNYRSPTSNNQYFEQQNNIPIPPQHEYGPNNPSINISNDQGYAQEIPLEDKQVPTASNRPDTLDTIENSETSWDSAQRVLEELLMNLTP